PFDEHAHVGGGALVGIQDADLIVGQANVGDLRIELGQALAQADVQRVEGAVSGFGGAVNIVLRSHRDGGGGDGGAAGGAGRDFVALHVEEVHAGAEGFAHRLEERGVGKEG